MSFETRCYKFTNFIILFKNCSDTYDLMKLLYIYILCHKMQFASNNGNFYVLNTTINYIKTVLKKMESLLWLFDRLTSDTWILTFKNPTDEKL